MSRSQQIATILGRLAGFTASVYFWFIMDDGPNNVFYNLWGDEEMNSISLICFTVFSILFVTLFTGFVSRLLFSFED